MGGRGRAEGLVVVGLVDWGGEAEAERDCGFDGEAEEGGEEEGEAEEGGGWGGRHCWIVWW